LQFFYFILAGISKKMSRSESFLKANPVTDDPKR
jgi:hypothetical protein